MGPPSKLRRTKQITRKQPLTKAMLLPLPVAISLENHLTLAAIRGGHGNVDQMSCPLKAVYLAYFMRDAQPGRGDPGAGLDAFPRARRQSGAVR